MNKKDLFNVAEAAFAAMLSRNHLYIDYFTLWARERSIGYGGPIYDQWTAWAKCRDFDKWLIASFGFDQGHIPVCVWQNLHDQWNTWLEQNIKN